MWVAKDHYGALCLYNTKPTQNKQDGNWFIKEDTGCGDNYEYDYLQIDSSLFPLLKWTDEPIQVELWSKMFWKRTIDDIVHKYITKSTSRDYACVNDIVDDITDEICGDD